MDDRSRTGITFFADWERGIATPSLAVPLKIIFLTSVRDTGTCDLNGMEVDTREGPRMMEGVIERTIRETQIGGALDGLIRVVGVVTDDLERDMCGSPYPTHPIRGLSWLHPLDLRTPHGEWVTDLTRNIPSRFRSLPRDDIDKRYVQKQEFERAVLKFMRARCADILVSDHYMARMDYLIGEFGLYGRVLNIHPAVTVADHPFCFRGKTPTADAIAQARSGILTRTGATLHLINAEIDAGPAVAIVADTPVYADDEPQHLRYRNYQQAKLPLFVQAIAHYARRLFFLADAPKA